MSKVVTAYLFLAIAISSEVIGSVFLQKSAQFTRLVPSLLVVIFYVLSFYCLSLSLRVIPLGIAYAIWSGIGIVLTALLGLWIFGQRLDWGAIAGMALIIIGVLVINLFSRAVAH